MLGALVLLVCQSHQSPLVSRFAASFHKRQTDYPADRVDPHISDCMDTLIQAAKIDSARKDVDVGADAWLEPYRKGIGFKQVDGEWSRFADFDLGEADGDGLKVFTARMGRVTRTRVFGRNGQEIRIPSEWRWTEFSPKVVFLPNHLCLFNAGRLQEAGMHVGLKLVWFRPLGDRFVPLKSVTTAYTLAEDGPVTVSGNLVTARTTDFARAFIVSGGLDVLSRTTVWDCSSGRPKPVKTVLGQPELRAVDTALVAAWSARRPSVLQRRLLRAWPHQDVLDDWKVVKLSDRRWELAIKDGPTFVLKSSAGGLQVVGVRTGSRPQG